MLIFSRSIPFTINLLRIMIVGKTQKVMAHIIINRFAYLSKKALDDIEKAHGASLFQRMLMYSKQARYIAKEGFFSFKKDLGEYFKLQMLEKVENKTLTEEQQALKKKIAQDMKKLRPIVLINILPMSPPLLIFYLLTYPTKVPSYFCLDQLFDIHQKQSILKQKQAVEVFKSTPIDPTTFNVSKQTLQELKLLSQLLFGHFEDGVVGINKYFKNNPKKYLLHPRFSKHLVIRKIKEELKKDVEANQELANLSIDELVLWKYDRVMKGQDRVIYKPIMSNTQPLNPEALSTAPGNDENKPTDESQHSKKHAQTRHNPVHRIHEKTVEHERHAHKSETRKNK